MGHSKEMKKAYRQNFRCIIQPEIDRISLEITRIDCLIGDEGSQNVLLERVDQLLGNIHWHEEHSLSLVFGHTGWEEKVKSCFRSLRNRCADLIEEICNGRAY